MSEERSAQNAFNTGRSAVRRGAGGRFASEAVRTPQRVRKIQRQRGYILRIKDIKHDVHDQFLVAFVLSGSRNEFIPSSRSRGCLQDIFNTFVSENYRLGPNLRYSALRTYVLDGLYVDLGIDGEVNVPPHPSKYPYCRLPKSRFSSEMRQIRAWFVFLHRTNCLVQQSVDEAFDECVALLNRSWEEDSPRVLFHAEGSTPQRVNTESQEGCPRCGFRAVSGNRPGDYEGSGSRPVQAAGRVELAPRGVEDGREGASNVVADAAGEVERKLRRALEFFETSKDHNSYVMVHLVLVQGAEWEFGLFASLLLTEWEKQGLTPTDLMREVLTFASWKNNRIVDMNEHAARERKLRETATLMDNIRLAIRSAASTEEERLRVCSQFKLFHEMTWNFMLEGTDPASGPSGGASSTPGAY